jgi:hypothetical protein
MYAGARATGWRARSGSRGDRDPVFRSWERRPERTRSPRVISLLWASPPRPSSSAEIISTFRAFSTVCREENFASSILGSILSADRERPSAAPRDSAARARRRAVRFPLAARVRPLARCAPEAIRWPAAGRGILSSRGERHEQGLASGGAYSSIIVHVLFYGKKNQTTSEKEYRRRAIDNRRRGPSRASRLLPARSGKRGRPRKAAMPAS